MKKWFYSARIFCVPIGFVLCESIWAFAMGFTSYPSLPPIEVEYSRPYVGYTDLETNIFIKGKYFKSGNKVSLLASSLWTVGSYSTPGTANSITISGNYAYVALGESGFQVFDISLPAAPTFVGSYNTPGAAYDIHISGDYAYVADSSSLLIINIANPATPFLIGSIHVSNYAFEVKVIENYAYLADEFLGLFVIDVSNPAEPSLVDSLHLGTQLRGLDVSGNHAYVGVKDGLRVVNTSNPSDLILVGTYTNSSDLEISTSAFRVSGNYAYIADNWAYFRVIDLSIPSNPMFVGYCNIHCTGSDIYVLGDFAFVAGRNRGFYILDLSDREIPVIVKSQYYFPDVALAINISGDFAYAACRYAGLQILDITNRNESPVHLIYNEGSANPVTNIEVLDESTITATLPEGLPEGEYHIRVASPEAEYLYSDLGYLYGGGYLFYAFRVTNALNHMNSSLRVLTGYYPTNNIYKNHDVNGDGKLGMVEAAYVLQVVSGLRATTPWGLPPPEPEPSPAPEPPPGPEPAPSE